MPNENIIPRGISNCLRKYRKEIRNTWLKNNWRLFSNKTQRLALERLFKKFGAINPGTRVMGLPS